MKKISVQTLGAKLCPAAGLRACAAVVLAAAILFSCKKDETPAANKPDEMATIATVINGEAIKGTIASGSNETGVTLSYNNGGKYILLQAKPGVALQGIHDIQNATIITSQYGVIVKSETEDKVWLFANNDAESLQRFETVKQQLHSSYVSETVYGVTIVKS